MARKKRYRSFTPYKRFTPYVVKKARRFPSPTNRPRLRSNYYKSKVSYALSRSSPSLYSSPIMLSSRSRRIPRSPYRYNAPQGYSSLSPLALNHTSVRRSVRPKSRLDICVKRHERREVIFATGRQGAGHKPARYKPSSSIIC